MKHKFETIKQGSTGADVVTLQLALTMLGFVGADKKKLVIDGECGKNTVYAINSFQSLTSNMGINTGNRDGIFGENCWQFLTRG